jgi:hypothetical protein
MVASMSRNIVETLWTSWPPHASTASLTPLSRANAASSFQYGMATWFHWQSRISRFSGGQDVVTHA